MKIPGCPWMRITLKFLRFQGSRVGNLKGQFYLDGDGIELQTWEKFDARYEPTYCSACLTARYSNNFPTLSNIYVYIYRTPRTFLYAINGVNNSIDRARVLSDLIYAAQNLARSWLLKFTRVIYTSVYACIHHDEWFYAEDYVRYDPHVHQSRV